MYNNTQKHSFQRFDFITASVPFIFPLGKAGVLIPDPPDSVSCRVARSTRVCVHCSFFHNCQEVLQRPISLTLCFGFPLARS